MVITYYKLPLDSIPFEEIPSLERLRYKYIYCSSFSLNPFNKMDLNLVSVYNAFDDEIEDIKELQEADLLFGKVVCDKLPLRGKVKCLKMGPIEKQIEKTDLPHLKYNSSDVFSINGNWFYMKDGEYAILKGIKSEYEKVKHLEGIAVYGDNIIRLRIVIELLKKHVQNGILKLTEGEYKKIAYKVLRDDPTLLRADEDIIVDGVNNWVPSMLLTPIYTDIPKEYRDKVRL